MNKRLKSFDKVGLIFGMCIASGIWLCTEGTFLAYILLAIGFMGFGAMIGDILDILESK